MQTILCKTLCVARLLIGTLNQEGLGVEQSWIRTGGSLVRGQKGSLIWDVAGFGAIRSWDRGGRRRERQGFAVIDCRVRLNPFHVVKERF